MYFSSNTHVTSGALPKKGVMRTRSEYFPFLPEADIHFESLFTVTTRGFKRFLHEKIRKFGVIAFQGKQKM
jgi:hypothetical protein